MPGTLADFHMLTQDLSRRPTSFENAIEAARKDWRVLANPLSHLCTHSQIFTRHPPFTTAGATLPSPANFKFLRHIKAWILPLDSSVDNQFCKIDNSISLCTRSLNNTADTVADIQWRIYSSRYIYSGSYTVANTVEDIQYRIKIHIHRGRYTGADTPPGTMTLRDA